MADMFDIFPHDLNCHCELPSPIVQNDALSNRLALGYSFSKIIKKTIISDAFIQFSTKHILCFVLGFFSNRKLLRTLYINIFINTFKLMVEAKANTRDSCFINQPSLMTNNELFFLS